MNNQLIMKASDGRTLNGDLNCLPCFRTAHTGQTRKHWMSGRAALIAGLISAERMKVTGQRVTPLAVCRLQYSDWQAARGNDVCGCFIQGGRLMCRPKARHGGEDHGFDPSSKLMRVV